MKAEQIINSTSGSAEFKAADQILTYRVVIEGTPNSNIKIFRNEKENTLNAFFLKFSCSDWNGASVKLQAKTDHQNDDFSDTGDIISSDLLTLFYY